jgi:hypothetical protein
LSEQVVQDTFHHSDLKLVEKFVESRQTEEKVAEPFKEELKTFTTNVYSKTSQPPVKKRRTSTRAGAKARESKPAFMRTPPHRRERSEPGGGTSLDAPWRKGVEGQFVL